MADFEAKITMPDIDLPKFKDCELKVGWFEDSKYDDNTSVAKVAQIQEFGTGRIPMRPFMRPAEANHGKEWLKIGQQEIKKDLMAGKNSIADAMDRLGFVIQGNIQEEIAAVQEPPLAAKTIQHRLTMVQSEEITPTISKPLIEPGVKGGILFASVQHKVTSK